MHLNTRNTRILGNTHRKQEATSFQTEVGIYSVWNAETHTQKYINQVIRKTGTREESGWKVQVIKGR